MANANWADTSVPRHLPDRVAQWYYTTGVFCSSHPYSIITVTSIFILLCSYPLLNLSLPGNVPQSFTTYEYQLNITSPRWFLGKPKLYIQQVIMRGMVEPWNEQLLLTDAFRGPLAETFKLLQSIHNYQLTNGSISLNNLCLNIESVKKTNNKMTVVLPEYNCLVLSPANLWLQDYNKFQQDSNLINTIYSYQGIAKGKTSISEMLFGLPLPNSGIKRYPLSKKQRTIQFAVTIFMTQYHSAYIDGLREYLHKLYPLSDSFNSISNNNSQSYMHIYYPEDVNYCELVPLSITYLIIFSFVYFYFRKIEHIKNRAWMALSVVVTVIASLSTTIGICSFFGLEYTGSKEIVKQVFLYLITVVGLENVFVLVLSVVSTTSHLDVKIRVAQGLSKEGWNMTKHFLIIVTILTAGLLTFVPAIQEFCIFFIVALLSDLFLQIIFFMTILSLNVECTEQLTFQPHGSYVLNIPLSFKGEENRRLPRCHSHPRLTGQNIIAPIRQHRSTPSHRVAKRVKVVHFWARTRFVQRSFMIFMVVWISVIVYNAETIQNFIKISTSSETDDLSTVEDDDKHSSMIWKPKLDSKNNEIIKLSQLEETKPIYDQELIKNNDSASEVGWMKRLDYDTRRTLSLKHWSSVLSLYNISLSGSYVTLLPTINVVHLISAQVAQTIRNPEEKGIKFMWQSLAVALDPIDFPDLENNVRSSVNVEGGARVRPFIPSSPMEIFMASLLGITSVFVLGYFFIVMYRCICTRNYAEWRTSWASSADMPTQRTQVVMEAFPIEIEGHTHMIECISTHGNVIASSCLGGHVKIWDSASGELISHLNRNISISDFQSSRFSIGANVSEMEPRSGIQCQSALDSYCLQNSVVDANHVRHRFDRWKNREFSDEKNERNNVPVWSMDCSDNIVVLGCVDGCIEFWDCITGELKCVFIEEDGISITAVKIVDRMIVAAKLNGFLCFYKLEVVVLHSFHELMNIPTRRGHVRTGSVDSVRWQSGSYEKLRCMRISYIEAHKKPISVLLSKGGRVVTGSEDKKLKVFNLDNRILQPYTLLGHDGPITCAFIDQDNPALAGSGSQDGSLCVWDLQTRSCMFSISAHDGTIFALTYSASYVISLGLDERICVWDRFQGHLLNTITLTDSYCMSFCMLTHNLLVTSKQDFLVVLDVGTGEIIHQVNLSRSKNSCTFIRQIVSVDDGIVCDYGRQLRLVRFPFVWDKSE